MIRDEELIADLKPKTQVTIKKILSLRNSIKVSKFWFTIKSLILQNCNSNIQLSLLLPINLLLLELYAIKDCNNFAIFFVIGFFDIKSRYFKVFYVENIV